MFLCLLWLSVLDHLQIVGHHTLSLDVWENELVFHSWLRADPYTLGNLWWIPDQWGYFPIVADTLTFLPKSPLIPSTFPMNASPSFSVLWLLTAHTKPEATLQTQRTGNAWEFTFTAILYPKALGQWLAGTGKPNSLQVASTLWYNLLSRTPCSQNDTGLCLA